MVKKRGYRIELGEIESALYRHDGVNRAGVVAQAGEEGVAITAFVALKPSQREVDHRHEAALHTVPAELHDPGQDHVSRPSAGDLDRQGRLSEFEGPGL